MFFEIFTKHDLKRTETSSNDVKKWRNISSMTVKLGVTAILHESQFMYNSMLSPSALEYARPRMKPSVHHKTQRAVAKHKFSNVRKKNGRRT